jgi:broad specificity phosphatase PhoE
MTTTTIILIRHGETDSNKNRLIQGNGIDTLLNANGHLQAEKLSERLASWNIHQISPVQFKLQKKYRN